MSPTYTRGQTVANGSTNVVKGKVEFCSAISHICYRHYFDDHRLQGPHEQGAWFTDGLVRPSSQLNKSITTTRVTAL